MSHFVIVENKEQFKKYVASYSVPKGKYEIQIDTSMVQLRNETVEHLTFEFVNCFTNISKTYATIPTKIGFTATNDVLVVFKLNHFRANYVLKLLPIISFIESSYNKNVNFYHHQVPENTFNQTNFESSNDSQRLLKQKFPIVTPIEHPQNSTASSSSGIYNKNNKQSNLIQKYRTKLEEEKQSFLEEVPLVSSKLKKRLAMILDNLLSIKELVQLKHIENKDENAIMLKTHQDILTYNFNSLLEITKSNETCFAAETVDITTTNLGITNGETYPKIPRELYIDILGNSNYHKLLHYLSSIEFIRLTSKAREKIDHLIQTSWKYFDFLLSKLVGFETVWNEYFGLVSNHHQSKETSCEI